MAERAAGAGGYHQDPDVYPFDLLLRSLVGIRLFRPSKDWVFTGERFTMLGLREDYSSKPDPKVGQLGLFRKRHRS